MFKVWDQLFGAVPAAGTECRCSRCECAKGNRSLDKWRKLAKPDYSELLTASFWLGTASRSRVPDEPANARSPAAAAPATRARRNSKPALRR